MLNVKKGDIIRTQAGCHYLVLAENNNNNYKIDVKPAPPEFNLKVSKKPVPWLHSHVKRNKVIKNIYK
jgi:hypothetical protein